MPLLPSLLLLLAAAQAPGAAGQASDDAAAEAVRRVSAFTLPVFLDDLPPEVRSVRLIHLVHADVPNVARNVTRTRAEALELGSHVTSLLRAGADFTELAQEYSAARNAGLGGTLGSFPPGLLAPPMDAFLFRAKVGDVSDPIETEGGVHVLQRIETYAATRHILVRGKTEEAEARAKELLERVRGGEDFGALARVASDDVYSKARDGLFTIFERGPNDQLLKKAAFEARVGETVGPIESPVGYHLIQRVPLEGHPADLHELTTIRVRAILISHDNTPLGGVTADRPMGEAERLATEIRDRIRSGEDMAALARRYNDDVGGKEREGDLGWLHRNNPRTAPFLDKCFTTEPGEVLGPVLTNVGYAVVRREI